MILDMKVLLNVRNGVAFRISAFGGEFNLAKTAENILNIKWINKGDWAELFIDLEKMRAEIKFSAYNGKTNLTVH